MAPQQPKPATYFQFENTGAGWTRMGPHCCSLHLCGAELQARSSRVPLLIFLCSSWLDSFSAFFHWAFPLLNSKDILYFRLEHGVHDKAGEHMGSTNIWMVRAQLVFSDHLLLCPRLGMLWDVQQGWGSEPQLQGAPGHPPPPHLPCCPLQSDDLNSGASHCHWF